MSKRPNVFVFFLDTIRADQLKGCETPGEAENFIERTLHQGTFFNHFIVGGNSTRVSVNAFFNGFYGGTTGFNYHYQCDDDFNTSRVLSLADLFKFSGYRTVGISQGDVYLPTFGFDRFLVFQDTFDPAEIERQLELQETPTFAYLHFSNLHDMAFGKPELMTAENYRLHLNELAEEVEGVWNRVVGPLDIAVIVSDHGCHLRRSYDPNWQFFFEEEPTGGIFLSEATVRGICSIVAPGRFPRRRVDSLVRGVDIFPTLLDSLNLPRPRVQGCSLWDAVNGNANVPELTAYMETGGVRMANGQAISRGIRDQRWKYNRYETKGEELFDLETDPKEENNLIASSPADAARMRKRFWEQVAENRAGVAPFYLAALPLVQSVLAARAPLPELVRGHRASCFKGMIVDSVRKYLREQAAHYLPLWRERRERIAVYSASEHTQAFFAGSELANSGLVVGIVDSNPTLRGSRFHGVPVYALDEFEDRAQPTMIIVAHYFFATDMYIRIKETCRRPIPVFNVYRLDREIPLWWDRGGETSLNSSTPEASPCR